MELPAPGQRYAFTGRGVVSILGVTRTHISYKVETPDTDPHHSFKPHAEFMELLQATIAESLNNITEDDEV